VTTIADPVGDVPEGHAFGSAVMIDVLERVDDDQGELRGAPDRRADLGADRADGDPRGPQAR